MPRTGLEPARLAALAPETSASTIPPPGLVVSRLMGCFFLPLTVILYVAFFVGVKGFEPSTPCSQSRCANRTALRPESFAKITFFSDLPKFYLFFLSFLALQKLHFALESTFFGVFLFFKLLRSFFAFVFCPVLFL